MYMTLYASWYLELGTCPAANVRSDPSRLQLGYNVMTFNL